MHGVNTMIAGLVVGSVGLLFLLEFPLPRNGGMVGAFLMLIGALVFIVGLVIWLSKRSATRSPAWPPSGQTPESHYRRR